MTDFTSNSFGYFILTDGVSLNNFIIKLPTPEKVLLAREIIAGNLPALHVQGNIITETVSYNRYWSFHLDPNSIEFFSSADQSCNKTFTDTESNIANVGLTFLPSLKLCPWKSQLVAEVEPGQVEQEFVRSTEYWSPNNSSQGITVNGEQIRRLPDFYDKFHLVSGTLPDGLTLSVDGIISGNVSLVSPAISNPITEFQYTLAMANSAVSDIAAAVNSIAASAGVTLPSTAANAFSSITNLKQLADAQGLSAIQTYSASIVSPKPYYLANHVQNNVYNFGSSYKYFLKTGNQSGNPGSQWRLREGYLPPNSTLTEFGELTVNFGKKILPYQKENFLTTNLPNLGNLEPEFWDECLKEFMQFSHEYDYQFMVELVSTANVAITSHTFRIVHLRAPTWSEWFMTNKEYISLDPEQYYYYICSSESENITWETPAGLLGNIDNGQISEFSVQARSDNNEIVHIDFKPAVANKFPHGLRLQSDGIMSGRVGFRCAADDPVNLPNNDLYTFTLRAYSENYDSYAERQFSIQVNRTSTTPSENIWINAYPYIKQRHFFYNIMNNQNIFPDQLIYRLGDPWFGKANKIRVLFAPGLNVISPAAYEQVLESNHYDKKLLFGQVKTAVALNNNLNIDYEVVYLTLIDEHMSFDNITRLYNRSVPATIDLRPYISNYYIEDGISYYILKPNSLLNMKGVLLQHVGVKQTNLFPRWMTSPQPIPNRPGFFTSPLGFQFAVVLCYCKPGGSAMIARALESINFNEISFEFDRYQLESRPAMYYDFMANTYQAAITTAIDSSTTEFDDDSTRFVENYDSYADPELGDKYLKFPKTKVFK